MRFLTTKCLGRTCSLLAIFALVATLYWPGLHGSWLFDDYPNIVENHGVQPSDASFPALINAALSSPASEFKRPLASLSFAANYLAAGLDPYWMKLTNLVIHLLNGMLAFLLARLLLLPIRTAIDGERRAATLCAGLIATGWMLLPINLTAVLYVVQRMESMANAFVLLGLLGYLAGRRRMTMLATSSVSAPVGAVSAMRLTTGFMLCVTSIVLCTAAGVLAKETAVMLPLYAWLVEWVLFRFRTTAYMHNDLASRHDWRITGLFVVVLIVPMLVGLSWLLPSLVRPDTWATRDFTLGTRLLSEARIVVDYIGWTLLPMPSELSFYHDDFAISTGLLSPWTTLASLLTLAILAWFAIGMRRRRPLVALGIALFLGSQLLTATVLPLELIYEHRNYFASFGLLLALVPILAAPLHSSAGASPLTWLRLGLLAGLMLWWATLTETTAYAWGDQLRLAQELVTRGPASPRAQYELGRTYIIYSHNDPTSPDTRLAYAPLERAASLPGSSILPQQALIFMNSRMHLPLKDAWWDSMIAKLRARPAGVQDESSLAVLTQCARDEQCDLPTDRMRIAFEAAIAHPHVSARLMATYADYAWNVLDDHASGLHLIDGAIAASPNEPAYYITQTRMLVALGHYDGARASIKRLESMNLGGRLDGSINDLRDLLPKS